MQHLNFYSQLDQKVKLIFSAKQQAWGVCGLLAVILLVYATLLVGKYSLSEQLDELQQQQQHMTASVESLKQKIQQQQENDTLTSEIKALQIDIAFRRQLLGRVDPENKPQQSFSEHLISLGRQTITGMWLTHIHLQNGGQQLALAGQTQKPEYVPQYLQKLSQESAFEGHQFRVLRMNTDKDNTGILRFKLQANDVEQKQ